MVACVTDDGPARNREAIESLPWNVLQLAKVETHSQFTPNRAVLDPHAVADSAARLRAGHKLSLIHG